MFAMGHWAIQLRDAQDVPVWVLVAVVRSGHQLVFWRRFDACLCGRPDQQTWQNQHINSNQLEDSILQLCIFDVDEVYDG